jgi:hypothetical protein
MMHSTLRLRSLAVLAFTIFPATFAPADTTSGAGTPFSCPCTARPYLDAVDRTDAEIALLKQENFEETRQRLRDGSQYAIPILSESVACPGHDFELMLQVRRVLKFTAELEARSLNQRIAILEAEMTSFVDAFADEADAVFAAYVEHLKKPEEASQLPGSALHGLHNGMMAILFAAAHTTDEPTLTALLKRREELCAGVRERCVAAGLLRGLPAPVSRALYPSQEDVFNLVMHCRTKSGGFAELNAFEVPDRVCAAVSVEPWDIRVRSSAQRKILEASGEIKKIDVHRFCATQQLREDAAEDKRTLERFDDDLSSIDVESLCRRD